MRTVSPIHDSRLEDVLAVLPDAALVLDGVTGDVLAANDLARRMFGYGREEMVAVPARALLGLRGAPSGILPPGGGVARMRLKGRRANGVPFAVEASARGVGDGRHGRVTVVLREPDRAELAGIAQRYFDVAFDNAPIGMALFNSDGEYVRVNAALCQMLGRSADELLGTRDQELTHPDDRQADLDAAWTILEGRMSTFQTEKRFVRPDGEIVWVIANLTFLRDEDGRPLSWVGQFQDITGRRATEEALRLERDLSDAIVTSMVEGFALTRGDEIVAVNDALCRLTGFDRDELVGSRAPYPFWPPEAREATTALRDEVIEHGGGEVEHLMMHKDGARFHALLTVAPAATPDGAPLGFVVTFRDISERKRHERELERRATCDGLTGLLNREAFLARLRREVAAAAAGGFTLSLAILDLDHFKAVNDTRGHPAGDRVLVETARRMSTISRTDDHLGRIGGEEFAWILSNSDGDASLRAVERARRAIQASPVGGVPGVTVSIGVCDLADAGDVDRLYELADAALYAAKSRGRNRSVRHRGG